MKYLVTFLFSFIACCTIAQSIEITGQVVDEKTNQPIEIAFLFVNNTSYGSETDDQGNFTLELPNDLSGELIISHINYTSRSIVFSHPDEIPRIIQLQLEPYELDEVLVTENKGKNRKKWIKKFTELFLGEKDADKVEILNPQDILFRESGETLEAIAKQPIQINNYRLGYKIRFLLEEFRQAQDKVVYSGKAFFEDMEVNEKNVAEAREKEYYQSTRYFFRKMIEESVANDFFDCHEASFLETGDYMIGDSYAVRDHVFQLYNSGYYVLAVPDALYVNGFGDLQSRKYNRIRKKLGKYASFLIPESRVILFNKYGVVINFEEVEEIEFWATKRVGALLPFNYSPQSTKDVRLRSLDWVSLGFLTESIYAEDRISKKMQEMGMLFNPLDLYLHLDRAVYVAGETIWFSIYGRNNRSRLIGNYGMGVELVNQDNEVEQFKVLTVNNGVGEGYMVLPDSMISGEYSIRYYLMNNEVQSHYSERLINILGGNATDSFVRPGMFQSEVDTVSIRFFPEGGNLIEGIECKVAFEVTDASGNYIDFKGEITNENGLSVPVVTLYKGMGYFQFIPDSNASYKIRSIEDSPCINYQLPLIKTNGASIGANTKAESNIKLTVTANDTSSQYRLIGHANGKVFSDHIFSGKNEKFLFNKEFIPTGVLHFTLFNERNIPISERLVFNDHHYRVEHIEVRQSNSFFRKKSKANLEVNSSNLNDLDSVAFLSISVTDDNLYDVSKDDSDILAEWLINNRVDKIIPAHHELLDKIGMKERFIMDLYMMVRGWRRFNWEDVHLMENQLNQGLSISGAVDSDRSNIKVVLTNFANPFYFDEYEVNDDLRFTFDQVPISLNGNFILQIKDLESDELISEKEARIILDRIQPLNLAPRGDYNLYQSASTSFSSILANHNDKIRTDSLLEFSLSVDLDEVVIKERREKDVRIYGLNDVSKLDWIDPKTPSRNMISMMKPGVRVLNAFDGSLKFQIINDQGFRIRVPATIYIDGVRQWNMSLFNSLTADRILYYGVSPPAIIIYTDPNGPRTLKNQVGSIYPFLLPGNDGIREFYRPVYEVGDNSKDYRTTIHWESGIILKKDMSVEIDFYTGDEDSTYSYSIQGMTSLGKPIYYTGKIDVKD